LDELIKVTTTELKRFCLNDQFSEKGSMLGWVHKISPKGKPFGQSCGIAKVALLQAKFPRSCQPIVLQQHSTHEWRSIDSHIILTAQSKLCSTQTLYP